MRLGLSKILWITFVVFHASWIQDANSQTSDDSNDTSSNEYDFNSTASNETPFKVDRFQPTYRLTPNIEVLSWLSQGVTVNPASPSNHSNGPLVFNDRSNAYQANQFYLQLGQEKLFQKGFHDWNIGWQIDFNFGSDSRFVTVPGLEENRDQSAKWNADSQEYGIAIPQAFVDLSIPSIEKLSIKVGHFYSIAGYERFPSVQNYFYSHSYAYSYSVPYTHVGLLGGYELDDNCQMYMGIVNGWDVGSLPTSSETLLAGFRLNNKDHSKSLSVALTSGRDSTGFVKDHKSIIAGRHYLNVIYKHQLFEEFRLVTEFNVGLQERGKIVVNKALSGYELTSSRWLGIAQYFIWQHTDKTSTSMRFEWFRDPDHSRLGVPIYYADHGPVNNGSNYFETTWSANYWPSNYLRLQPEIRLDWSDVVGNPYVPGGQRMTKVFNDYKDNFQLTFATNLLIVF